MTGCKEPLVPLKQFQETILPYVLSEEDYVYKCSDLKAAKEHSAFWGELSTAVLPDRLK